MSETCCMVGRCTTVAGTTIVLERNRLRLVYAVCLRHEAALRLGMHVQASAEIGRGLLGLEAPAPVLPAASGAVAA